MIRTLIKNDYILIEPFLLTSPSQRENETDTRGSRVGPGQPHGTARVSPSSRGQGLEGTMQQGVQAHVPKSDLSFSFEFSGLFSRKVSKV